MKQRLARHWPLLVIVVLTILLRLPLLNGSFWMDEAAQALESARPWSEQLQIRDDFQPPLLHLIVALAIRVDDSEWWLRTWGALIPGILTIVGSYFVALEVGKWVFKGRLDQSILLASLTTLLLATSSFHIFYSQELRQYSLPAMWGIWSWWVLIKMSDLKLGSRSWWGWSMGWVILSTLGLYSSYLYPFLLISQFVWIALTLIRHPELTSESDVTLNSFHGPRGKSDNTFSASSMQSGNSLLSRLCPWLHWLTLGLVILVAFLPWLPSFMDQLSAGQMLRYSLPGWETVVSTPQLKALALVGGKFLFGVSDITPNPYFAIYSLMFFGLVGICGYWLIKLITRHSGLDPESSNLNTENPNGMLKQFQHDEALFSRQGVSRAFILILIAFLLPLLTAWLISFLVPVLQPKRVLYLMPFWYLGLSLLISTVIASYQSWKVIFFPLALLVLLLIFNLGSTVVYWLDPTLQRENWRQVWLDIDQMYGDQTPKLFLFDGPFASWIWYDRQYSTFVSRNDFSFTGVRTADQTQAASLIQVASDQYTRSTLIYFDYLTDLTDSDRLVWAELENKGYSPVEIFDYPNIGFVRVFRK